MFDFFFNFYKRMFFFSVAQVSKRQKFFSQKKRFPKFFFVRIKFFFCAKI